MENLEVPVNVHVKEKVFFDEPTASFFVLFHIFLNNGFKTHNLKNSLKRLIQVNE